MLIFYLPLMPPLLFYAAAIFAMPMPFRLFRSHFTLTPCHAIFLRHYFAIIDASMPPLRFRWLSLAISPLLLICHYFAMIFSLR
jgi:hypothetical protein